MKNDKQQSTLLSSRSTGGSNPAHGPLSKFRQYARLISNGKHKQACGTSLFGKRSSNTPQDSGKGTSSKATLFRQRTLRKNEPRFNANYLKRKSFKANALPIPTWVRGPTQNSLAAEVPAIMTSTGLGRVLNTFPEREMEVNKPGGSIPSTPCRSQSVDPLTPLSNAFRDTIVSESIRVSPLIIVSGGHHRAVDTALPRDRSLPMSPRLLQPCPAPRTSQDDSVYLSDESFCYTGEVFIRATLDDLVSFDSAKTVPAVGCFDTLPSMPSPQAIIHTQSSSESGLERIGVALLNGSTERELVAHSCCSDDTTKKAARQFIREDFGALGESRIHPCDTFITSPLEYRDFCSNVSFLPCSMSAPTSLIEVSPYKGYLIRYSQRSSKVLSVKDSF